LGAVAVLIDLSPRYCVSIYEWWNYLSEVKHDHFGQLKHFYLSGQQVFWNKCVFLRFSAESPSRFDGFQAIAIFSRRNGLQKSFARDKGYGVL
jgi:hypothetical protein